MGLSVTDKIASFVVIRIVIVLNITGKQVSTVI